MGGPIIDININIQKHEIYQLQALWVSLGISKNLGLPCIYDSLLLIRPECSFREGIRIQNKLTSKRRFYEEINKEESLVQGIMACDKLMYTKLKTGERQGIKNEILANSQGETALGLAPALILVKAYSNWLIVEVNQICYGGIVRTIALGFTEGISSWKVEAFCTFRPLVVPVGRSTLGRLFNVLEATIDAYSGLDELQQYADYAVSFNQEEENSKLQIVQKVQMVKTRELRRTMKINGDSIVTPGYLKTLIQSVFDVFTALSAFSKNLSHQEENLTQQIKLESLGFVCIMGLAGEIIKTRDSEVMSFSNVSSTAAQEKSKSNIIEKLVKRVEPNLPQWQEDKENITSNIYYEILKEIKAGGIKGSVARERSLEPIIAILG